MVTNKNKLSRRDLLLGMAGAATAAGRVTQQIHGTPEDIKISVISSIPMDLSVLVNSQQSGPKQQATIAARLGGPAANAAPIFRANNISACVIGAQACTLSGWVRQKASELGLQSIVVDRPGEPALTIAIPNGHVGSFALFVQRVSPLMVHELNGAPTAAIASADLVIVGPMPANHPETFDVLGHVVQIARDRYRALLPHPSLITSSQFRDVARRFNFLAVNRNEAALLDSSTTDIEKHALRMRHLLGEHSEFVITNSGARGLLYAEGSWFVIDPPPVNVVSDIGAGDSWATGYLIARQLFGAAPQAARDYALHATASVISAQPVPRYR